jgi:hypothetical protein
MKIIIIICFFVLFIILFYINITKKYNINKNILPFSYQIVNCINTSNKNDFFILLNKYGTKKDIYITKKILSIHHTFAPTWGIKIDKNNNIEFEMYFYIYNPIHIKYEPKSITINKLKHVFEGDFNYDKKNLTMYSIDYSEEYLYPNFYYFISTNKNVDIGYSLKKNKLNNYYYRYYPNTIDTKFKKFIDNKLINYNIKDKKTIFISDKLIRNYYGIYYDGINYKQLEYFIKKYNYDINIINNLNKNNNYSISVDYNKNNYNIEKIGIYGVLY